MFATKKQDIRHFRQLDADLKAEAQRIYDRAEGEHRDLTAEDRQSIAAIRTKLEANDRDLRGADLVHSRHRAEVAEQDRLLGGDGLFGVTPEGTRLRIYRHNEPLSAGQSEREQEDAQGALGRLIQEQLLANHDQPPVPSAAASGASQTAGGALLAFTVSTRIFDLARNKTRVSQAGALFMPMPTSEVRLAKITADPTASWRQENKSIAASDLTFGAVTLRAKTLGVLTKSSVEVMEDAVNFGRVVEHSIAEAIALEWDRVALLGTGSAAEPLGLENATGVNTRASVGTPSNYDDFSSAVQDVAEDNGEASAIIMAPRTFGTLDRLKDTTNQPLQPPQSYQELDKLLTNQVPTTRGGSSNESLAFVGDFSNMILGVRTSLHVESSRQAAKGSSSAFTDLQVWVRGYLRADIAVVRPNHFCVMSGITA